MVARCVENTAHGHLYQSPSQSSQKQQLKTPSLRCPLLAGGTLGAYTNRRAKVCKCVGFESPLTSTLSPLDKGGEGREWGDSARAAICELCPRDWY